MRKVRNRLGSMKKPMNQEEISEKLEALIGWSWEDDKLSKAYGFKNFREAMVFLVRLSYEAEEQNHHPEIFNCYKQVKISLNTHDAGGKVTEKDFRIAHAIDSIA
jgi:4a-hydroxytetrahydrobiopterin dehydratase